MTTYSVTFVLADNATQFTTKTNAVNLDAATLEVERWLTKGSVRLVDQESKTETLMASFILRYIVAPDEADHADDTEK